MRPENSPTDEAVRLEPAKNLPVDTTQGGTDALTPQPPSLPGRRLGLDRQFAKVTEFFPLVGGCCSGFQCHRVWVFILGQHQVLDRLVWLLFLTLMDQSTSVIEIRAAVAAAATSSLPPSS